MKGSHLDTTNALLASRVALTGGLGLGLGSNLAYTGGLGYGAGLYNPLGIAQS
jgi:hypothetical protein